MKITFNTTAFDELHINVADDKVKEYIEALYMLGFEPVVSID